GVIGQSLAGFGSLNLGFTGCTLALLVMVAVGLSLFFGFSWLAISEKIGRRLESLMQRGQQGYDAWQDRRAGALAQAERTEHVVVKQEKLTHEQPLRIEPAIVEVPKSKRQEKEKQKARQPDLFKEIVHNGDLPPLALLDEAPASQETI